MKTSFSQILFTSQLNSELPEHYFPENYRVNTQEKNNWYYVRDREFNYVNHW
jgi:hypothetical protein